MKTSIENCLFFMKINSNPSVLTQFHPKHAMNQAPFYSIEYSGSCRPFLFRKSQLIKSHHYCVTLMNAILYKKLSQWHHFQPQNHTVMASIHMLVSINCMWRTFLLKSTMVIFFIFHFARKSKKKQKLAFTYSTTCCAQKL